MVVRTLETVKVEEEARGRFACVCMLGEGLNGKGAEPGDME